MIRLGGHGFKSKSDDPKDIAQAHLEFGYRAAYCPNVKIGDADRLKAIREAFAEKDILIAEVGAWGNLIAPERERCEKNLKNAMEKLAIADEVGALCCVDYLGTLVPNSDIAPHPALLAPAGFDMAVETVRHVIDAVKPKQAKFCLEMMQWMPPWSPDMYADLLKAVEREAFAVHVDPVNIIVSPQLYYSTDKVIRHIFGLLGPHIMSCHAKDVTLHPEAIVHIDEVPALTGNLHYETYLKELDKLPQDAPLMLEHLKAEQYAPARDRLFALADKIGVEFLKTKGAART